MKTSRPFAEMLEIAEEVKRMLHHACERIEIAGSIRRKAPMVGDIEIVAIPQTIPDLFGTPMEHTQVDLLIRQSPFFNEIYKDGPKYKQFTVQAGEGNAHQVDLFLATEDNWGYILMLRTGPADFGRKMVTPIMHGGRLPPGIKVGDGVVRSGGRVVSLSSEEALFRHWGMDYIEPEDRR